MAKYNLYLGHYTKDNLPDLDNKPFAKLESITDARIRAVKTLLKLNKRGWYVTICNNNGYEMEGIGIVYDTVMSGREYSAKPTVGLKEGYKFTSFDGSKSRIINKDGSLGKVANW